MSAARPCRFAWPMSYMLTVATALMRGSISAAAEPEAAAAAHADHADAFAVHEGQPAEEIDSGAEVLDEGFR